MILPCSCAYTVLHKYNNSKDTILYHFFFYLPNHRNFTTLFLLRIPVMLNEQTEALGSIISNNNSC